MSHFRAALFALSIGLLAPACERANDTPKLQEEAREVAKDFQARFDEAAERAESLSKRGNAVQNASPASAAEARKAFAQALGTIENARQQLKAVPTQIEAGTKTDDRAALPKLIDELRTHMEHDLIAVNADLDGVESWISNAEAGRVAPAPAPSASAAGTVQEGAPQPTGSDAPVQ